MKNLLIFIASEDAYQDALAAKYVSEYNAETELNPKNFISYNEENDSYDLITNARYPHVYSRNGIQSVITMQCTTAQETFITGLASAIDILAECDGSPDSDYQWTGTGAVSENKFKVVVGQDFFTGSGTIGEEGYHAPRKKLAVLSQ